MHTEILLTIVVAVSLGTILTAVARKTNISAIVLLLIGGIIAGPQGFGLVKPDSLQEGLRALVSLSIGLILFEGGLTLDVRGYRQASRIIMRLLTVGVLVTWLTTAGCLKLVFNFPTAFALTAASLVIVTGPTVMVPILKRIRIQPLLHNILHWEAVLIDPIGVFIAVMCFEYISGHGSGSVLTGFALRVFTGLSMGVLGGLVLLLLIRKRIIDEDLIEIVPLAIAALIFGISEALGSESGLLTTTVAGLILGASGLAELKQVRRFKSALTDLLIGMLFILLAARLNIAQFTTFGWKGIAAVAAVMFLVRPLNILASTFGLPITGRQRAFLSWVAPRGIVAASMSSLVALSLEAKGMPQAKFIESFTYAVIVGTVILQGLSAGWLARRLKLCQEAATGWLILGAHVFARKIADFIRENANVPVVLLDSNPKAIQEANAAGLTAIWADARDTELLNELPELQAVGNLLAITDNEDLNTVVGHRWAETLGTTHLFGWHSEAQQTDAKSGSVVWTHQPKPSIVSGDLDRGLAELRTLTKSELSKAPAGEILMAARPGRVWFEPKPGSLTTADDKTRVLVFERGQSHLLSTIRPDLFVESQATTLDELYDGLIEKLVNVAPRISSAKLKTDLLDREKTISSSMGHGVAIPHVYSPAVPQRLCAIARHRSGLAVPSLDNMPLRLVFLLVGPPGDPEGHIALLAEIARLVGRPHIREQILNAASYSEISAIVRNAQITSQLEGN